MFFLVAISLSAQVKIGDNANLIDDSSILELESTNKGLLIPRLTTTQINAIVSPANGLLVYNLDTNLLQVNIGTKDTSLWCSLVIQQPNSTGALLLPVGTNADRPKSPVNGMLRYNTQSSQFEVYKNGNWEVL